MKPVINARKYLLIIYLFSLSNIRGQGGSENFENDFNFANKIYEKYYLDGKFESLLISKAGYEKAIPIFLKLFLVDTTNMNLAFKLGVCYQNSRRKKAECIYYFKKAASSVTNNYQGNSYKERKAPVAAIKYLGDAYHLDYQFDKAIVTYKKYLVVIKKESKADKERKQEAVHKIEMCLSGKQLLKKPIKIKIESLGNNINSTYSDYSPVLSADQNTMFFTTRRIETTGILRDEEGNHMEDIYMSVKTNSVWSEAKSIGAPINTEQHEATVGLSPDGQTILIYKDDDGDGNIYSTTLKGKEWSKPVKLNENINSKYWEPSAIISADGNTIYFISNKPGGFGGRDLYTSKRMPNGEWGLSENMGKTINTIYDEDAPFIHPDGISLTFSSNGHNSMGGFDVFTSIKSTSGTWSVPENLGYPLNTTDDDIYYVLSPNNRTAYFSSFREGGMGDMDIYMATFMERKETPITLIKGNVIETSGLPAKNVLITITDNETEEVLGVFKANEVTGQFLFILTPGKNYNITYYAENHLFYSQNRKIAKETNYYEIFQPIYLKPIVVGSKIVLNNIFFDFDKAILSKTSNVELRNLITLLKTNPYMRVQISGHTDEKGDVAYNQKLSEERAQVVVDRLVAEGVFKDQISAKGYGELQPFTANKNEDGTDDTYGRQLNRRVEFEIIGVEN